jgi:hypothetical protein
VGSVGSVVRRVCFTLDDLVVVPQVRLSVSVQQPLSAVQGCPAACSKVKLWEFEYNLVKPGFSRYVARHRVRQ